MRLFHMLIRAFSVLLVATALFAQGAAKLQPKNVKAEDATYKGRNCIRLTDAAPEGASDGDRLALIPGSEFANGSIELDLTGDTLPNTAPTYRGFTGLAFRAAADGSAFECFYLRPKNGRAEDQEQRNHSTQYISVPEFPWQRLRQETPSKYESYVDLVPGEWTHVRIEVNGVKARLYVGQSSQPVLMVNDLKHGNSHGALAYWIGPGAIAHFANLKVSPRP